MKKTAKIKPAEETPRKPPQRETKTPPLVFRELPEVVMHGKLNVASMLAHLDSLRGVITAYQQEEQELRQTLAEVQAEMGVRGLRYGPLCFSEHEVAGRRTLDRGLLIANGVKAAIIEKSMKQGEPTKRREFRNLELEVEGAGAA